MPTLRSIGLFCLLLIVHGPVQAQSGGKAGDKTGGPAGKAPAAGSVGRPNEAEAKARIRTWLSQCMQDWDSGTHMTRQAWQRTCQRMARERAKTLDQGK